MTNALTSLSDCLSVIVSNAGAWVVAITVGPDTHVAGLAWGDGSIVTTDQGLPNLDMFSVISAGHEPVPARLVRHDAAAQLVLLRIERARRTMPLPRGTDPALGSLAVVVGADMDGAPTMRLAAVHRPARHAGQRAVLDIGGGRAQQGALVLDPLGALLGIVSIGTDGSVSIVPYWTITNLIDDATQSVRPAPTPTPALAPIQPGHSAPGIHMSGRRSWFGVALQPITIPEPLIESVGQSSGRLIVGVTAGGPADAAGLKVGDVLLSVAGHSTSGPNSLRAFLEGAEIGRRVEVRVLRDTSVVAGWLTVGAAP